jgi:N-dimethylarginine dimethylaminohydrolase
MNPGPVDRTRAQAQWDGLRSELTALGHRVEIMPGQPGLPDMVFAANGGIVIGDKALVPRFRHAERAPEAQHFAEAFAALGIPFVRQASHTNEGEGDFRLVGGRILAGTGPRSDPRAPAEVGDYFGLPVAALSLVDPRLYHLDTALAILDERTIAYWPNAFDHASQGVLRELFPDAIQATEADAAALALNLISDGSNVIMAPGADALAAAIAERGFEVRTAATDELLKAGGGAKCCVLEHHPNVGQRLRT